MKFIRITNSSGQFTISIERSEYDGVPKVSELTLDHAPLYKNPEREAVACALLFGSYCGGEFEFVQRVGPNTSAEIRRFFSPIEVSIAPMEYYPKALPIGRNSVVLGNSVDEYSTFSVVDLPSDKFNGAVRGHHSMAVASNSFMLKRSPNDIRPSLAVAVLFAEDFDIDSIAVGDDVNTEEFEKCRSLLSAVRLGLKRQKS